MREEISRGETMNITLKELAEKIGGEVAGDPEVCILGAADIPDAVCGEIVFAETPRHLGEAQKSNASAIIAARDADASGKPLIRVDNPRYAFARILEVFSPSAFREPGVHPTCIVGEGVTIGENPSIANNVYIGRNTAIGKNAVIYPFVYIDDNVTIGDNCIIRPSVTISDTSEIGNNVIIHSGTAVGSDGFGYIRIGNDQYKIPQIGKVVIGSNVEIGANVTIDRARTGKTVIGNGTKIDNLVHIAHNVVIGENSIIVAQVGIAGSTEIGSNVILAGQVGVKDHIKIGDNSVICAQGGVIGDVSPGEFLSGFPARPHREQMKFFAVQNKLPGLLRQVRDLEKRIKELEDGQK